MVFEFKFFNHFLLIKLFIVKFLLEIKKQIQKKNIKFVKNKKKIKNNWKQKK